MNKYVINLFVILILISFTTCKKPVTEIPPSLTVNPLVKEVDANQGSFTVNVISTITWSANCDKSWVTIDPSQGEGNSTIKATYLANTLTTNRTATITVNGNGVADKTISITQLGIQPVLTVSPANVSVAAIANSTTINITSNLSWNASSNQTWCTLAQSSGNGTATLNVNIQASLVQTQRTAIVTFSANGVTNQTVQITQAEFVPLLTVTQPSATVNSAQGTANYAITSNIAWSASCAANWVSIVNPTGVNNGTLSVNYDANNTASNRVATIILAGTGVTNQSLTLTQTNLIPTLSVTPANRDVVAAAGSTTYDISSNTAWTAQSDQSWCTITNPSGTGNTALTVNFGANTANTQRVATITISCNGLTPKTVTITQQGSMPTQGLVAYYPFNGNANDESGNGNNGTINGATLTTGRKGNTNNAYSFNGINNYITVLNSTSINLTSNLTISYWIKLNSNPEHSYKGISKGGYDVGSGYELMVSGNGGGVVHFVVQNNNAGSPMIGNLINQNIGTWINIIGIFNAGNLSFYVNGILSFSGTANINSLIPSSHNLYIGTRDPGNNYVGFLNGYMDDIRIYNRALSESEIQTLYNE